LNISARGSRQPKIDISRLEFRRLSPDCRREAFICGYTRIEGYFRELAEVEHNALHARVVTAHLDGNPDPVGFFSMSIKTEPEDLFERTTSLFPRLKSRFHQKSLLVVHLRWVAVMSDLHRRGVGTALMGRAIDDFYEVTDRTGIAALTLQPISRDASAFYASLGFSVFGDGELPPMFLPAETVMQVRERAGI